MSPVSVPPQDARIAIVLLDPNGRILHWNGAAEELFGQAPTEAIGRNLRDVAFADADADQVVEMMRQLQERQPWEGVVSVRRRNGSASSIHLTITPFVEEGAPLVTVAAVAADNASELSTGELDGFEPPFRMITESAPLATLAYNLDGRLIYANPAVEDLTGYTIEELKRRSPTELVHPDDRPRMAKLWRSLELGGSVEDEEFRIVTKVVDERWSLSSWGPLLDESGNRIGIQGRIQDITDRKRTERRLSAQYAVSRVLADSESIAAATPRLLNSTCESLGWELGAIWTVDPAARVLRCEGVWHDPSARVERFAAECLSRTFDRGIGLPGRVWLREEPVWIPDVTVDDNFPRAPVALSVGLHGAFGSPIRAWGRILGVIEFFSRTIEEPDAELLQAFDIIGGQIGQFIDRNQAQDAVRASEARKSAILAAAIDAVIMMDATGVITEFNAGAERIFGFAATDVRGKEMASLLIPPGLRERHRRGLARYRETGRGAIVGKRVEMPALRSDGTEFPVELTVTRVDLPGPPSFAAHIRDITELKRTEEYQAQLLASERRALEAADRVKEQLAFLAEASKVLSTSLDFKRTLAKVARLAVPRLGDWCAIHIEGGDGTLQVLEVAHADPTKVEMAKELQTRYPDDPDATTGPANVVRTGQSEIYPEIPEERLQASAKDEEHLRMLRNLGVRSAMVVPLTARGRVFGAISFVWAESDRRYELEDLGLAENLATRAATAIDNARLYEERSHVARTLQRSLLPPRLPDIPCVELAARYRPAAEGSEIGGDFYDVFEVIEGDWGLVIGDVCGKGVEAAALTGIARHTVRASALRDRVPSRSLEALNEAILREEGDRFCTVAFGRLRLSDGSAQLTVACAGHPPPLVLRANGTVEPAGLPGSLLGVFDDPEISDRTVELSSGDAVVFYTDGVTDERTRPLVGERALERFLTSFRGDDARTIADGIADAAIEPSALLRDDLALLVMRLAA